MSVYPSCSRKVFIQTLRKYCHVYGFERPTISICDNLWGIYKQDINANCQEDITVDIGQFLDNNQKYLKSEVKMITTNSVSLGCCVPAPTVSWSNPICWVDECCAKPASPIKSKVCPKQEVENTMSYEKSDITVQRDYFNRRINDVYHTHLNELQVTHRIYNSDQPKNYKVLIDAIKNGQYELIEKQTKQVDASENDRYWGPFFGIKWKLPDSPDFDGYNAAEKEVLKAKQTARDQIAAAVTGDAMLKAVADFEAWTPVGNA